MKRRTIVVHGMPMRAPNYKKSPFVMGHSIAVCDSCDAAVDTREKSFAGLRGWEVKRECGRVVGFACPACRGSRESSDVRVGSERR